MTRTLFCSVQDYPLSSPAAVVDLPLPLAASSFAAAGVSTAAAAAPRGGAATPLCSLYHRFVSTVTQCQAFFDQMDDLEAHSWILEPEQPIPRAAKHRRIAVGQAHLHTLLCVACRVLALC